MLVAVPPIVRVPFTTRDNCKSVWHATSVRACGHTIDHPKEKPARFPEPGRFRFTPDAFKKRTKDYSGVTGVCSSSTTVTAGLAEALSTANLRRKP